MSRAKVGQIASHLLKFATEPNGVTSEAVEIKLNSYETRVFSGRISTSTDVDVFKLVGINAGTYIAVQVFAQGLTPQSALDTYARIFDATGAQIAANDDVSNRNTDSFAFTTVSGNGDYYFGISAYGNSSYNVVSGSGLTAAETTGPYAVRVSIS